MPCPAILPSALSLDGSRALSDWLCLSTHEEGAYRLIICLVQRSCISHHKGGAPVQMRLLFHCHLHVMATSNKYSLIIISCHYWIFTCMLFWEEMRKLCRKFNVGSYCPKPETKMLAPFWKPGSSPSFRVRCHTGVPSVCVTRTVKCRRNCFAESDVQNAKLVFLRTLGISDKKCLI